MNAYIGIDVGTTNTKVGVLNEKGDVLTVLSFKTPINDEYYDPKLLMHEIIKMIGKLSEAYGNDYSIKTIGISSMAEGGIIVDEKTGDALTDIFPWYFKGSQDYYELAGKKLDPVRGFMRTGLHNSYKYSIYKLLYFFDHYNGGCKTIKWLSVADYVAYCLTGRTVTDYTLALRTYAFDIDIMQWDLAFLDAMHIPLRLMPEALPSGEAAGCILPQVQKNCGLAPDVTVSVCGHDHLCAAKAVDAVYNGDVFMSIGTTQVLTGSFPKRKLTMEDYNSGLSYGYHVVDNTMTWLGSIQASGRSIEWIRHITGIENLPYSELEQKAAPYADSPTGILYLPYLLGIGPPCLDIHAKAAFFGMDHSTTQGKMIKAVLEGIAYEARMILEHAGKIHGKSFGCIKAVGGGCRNSLLIQILSDILDLAIETSSLTEATVMGAANLAAYRNNNSGAAKALVGGRKIFHPRSLNRNEYDTWYASYRRIQQLIRQL